jgi:hypothetical protein
MEPLVRVDRISLEYAASLAGTGSHQAYRTHIPDSVSRAIEARTDAIFAAQQTAEAKIHWVLLNMAGQSKGKVSVSR